MKAKDFLISRNILTSPDLDLPFNLNMSRDRHIHSAKMIMRAMEDYARLAVESTKGYRTDTEYISGKSFDEFLEADQPHKPIFGDDN